MVARLNHGDPFQYIKMLNHHVVHQILIWHVNCTSIFLKNGNSLKKKYMPFILLVSGETFHPGSHG